MGKLYEVLAVEGEAKQTMTKVIKECTKTFSGRSGHFNEERKSYTPLDENDQDRPQEEGFSPMADTVKSKLDYVQGHVVKALDILLQKEKANQEAKGDIIVPKGDGTQVNLIKDVPVTVLVQLENVLANLRKEVYDRIPTLDPAKVWNQDPQRDNVWKAEPIKKQRTRKMKEAITLHPGTEKHAPQVVLETVDKIVGHMVTEVASGSFSPKQKSRVLTKLDNLIAGVKKARAKANDREVESAEMGKPFFEYINSGLNEA